MTQREEGFYWVKIHHSPNGVSDWVPGELTWASSTHVEFYVVGNEEGWPESMIEIGPHINPPEGVI